MFAFDGNTGFYVEVGVLNIDGFLKDVPFAGFPGGINQNVRINAYRTVFKCSEPDCRRTNGQDRENDERVASQPALLRSTRFFCCFKAGSSFFRHERLAVVAKLYLFGQGLKFRLT
eukprot:gnl/TRDRNA2_/TRDRNA2_172920_c9_seq1.p3 gnl/TRDRNA2_/TRDRNA2_172920_c9~~gnl/TRDRNA2_/TRDRNA2_172920_c9_seq1.p3  ORF type:complete len:116 (-),score=9.55 gnl/TRDRNA2_/TRDRNA2_172920_c9_seq1:688-1035(-)